MVEFFKGILRWIILAIIIIIIIVLIYNISNASSKNNTTNSLSSGVKVVEPGNKKKTTTEEKENNNNNNDILPLEGDTKEEVYTPDTASFSGISVFLGVLILGGTTYYIIKKSNIIKD